MSEIEVTRRGESEDDFSFEVTIRDQNQSQHQVTVSRGDLARLSRESEEPEAFVKRCFEFLLRREPKESILSKFDVSDIGGYFPEFEQTITT